jgi:hypothetical protein
MGCIVVANSNPAFAKLLAAMFHASGLSVGGVFLSGARLVEFTNRYGRGGVVVSSVWLSDMPAGNALRRVKPCFDFVFLVDPRAEGAACPPGTLSLKLPVNRMQLLATVAALQRLGEEGTPLSVKKLLAKDSQESQLQLVRKAQALLMERNALTEPEAYRMIQKKSMDFGRKMAETAFLILNGT